MRRIIATLAALALLAACGADDEPGEAAATSVGPAVSALPASAGTERLPPDPGAPVDELVAGLNDAGFDLLRTLPAEDDLVISPSSIGHALLMARAAAEPTTRDAIDAAFGLPDGESAHAAWNVVAHQLADTNTDAVTVRVADRIWPATGHEPAQEWVDLLAAHHGVDVQPLDLQADPGGSREIINGWVADQTEQLIPELLPEGFITPMTVLVLTDAWYFEADWRTPFGKYGPEEATFTRLDGSTTPVELMVEREIGDRAGVGDGFVGAEIPYAGDQYSMLVVVPDEGRFDEVRERFGQPLLDEIDATFTDDPYELQMPKWEDDEAVDLIPWLQEIGAAPGHYPDISADATLEGAVHGADIAVDEQGTVAAAATALGFLDSAGSDPDLVVRADRPFLYLIRHRDSGLVLFAGQVTDPTD